MALLPLSLSLVLPFSSLALADDLSNVVAIKQQRLWIGALKSRCGLSNRHIVFSAKQLWPINCCCVQGVRLPANLCGVGQQGIPSAACPVGILTSGRIREKERQELLWQDFFLDPTQWLDHRPHKEKGHCHPDFSHKTSREPLWLNNFYRPSWVELQLAMGDSRTRGHPGSAPTSTENVAGTFRDVGLEEFSEVKDISKRDVESLTRPGDEITESLLYRLLKRSKALKDLNLGIRVHALARKSGQDSKGFLANHIIGMYASHGKLEEAMQVFTNVAKPNAHMWASIILAHTRLGRPFEAIQLYRHMRESSEKPDNHIHVAALKACSMAQDLASGKEVHADIMKSAVLPNIYVGNCLVDMYSKCGSLEDAWRVFDRLPTRDVVTWTAMISGYAYHGLGEEALSLYARMQEGGMTAADGVTFVCLLQACTCVGDLGPGRKLHLEIQERGLEADVIVGSSLVDMYAKCNSLPEARRVFDRLPMRNVVTWNAMLGGYAQHGHCHEALALYDSMKNEGIRPIDRTFVCLLKACASVGALHEGMELHSQIQESGLETDMVVGSSLVHMYTKCGKLEEARDVFNRLPSKDVVTWNTIIAGYSHHELGQEALVLYGGMQEEGIDPNRATFLALLQACTSVGALQQGKKLQSLIRERGLETDLQLGSCLVDMYAKCGRLEDARSVFDKLPTRDVVTWTCLLNGYAQHSDGHMVLQCYEEMRQLGVEPNDATFLCLLVGCSHMGLVHEGQRYFKIMVEDHGIAPTVSHYNCMVDLLGRSGHLDDAENLLQTSPFDKDIVGWTSLLGASKSHGDIERGRRCFDYLIALEPEHASAYVLMANIYANAGRWRDVDNIERLRLLADARKKAAKAWIEVTTKVHEFTVGEDTSDISLKVRSLSGRLRDGGHVPQTELVLTAVSEQEKEDSLCGHAEKLALAYGLLNTPDGTALLVTKNLRMCNDCHCSTKIMSRVERREIVVRDAHRVHRFLDGSCSCGDRH